MYMAVTESGHLLHWGQGIADTGENVIYREVSVEAFQAEMEALPGWSGDWRMVVVSASGVPERYAPRELSEAERAADDEVRELTLVRTDAAAIRENLEAVLDAIQADLTEIGGGTTPATVAQLWGIVARSLQREQRALARERRYARVLARMVLRIQ